MSLFATSALAAISLVLGPFGGVDSFVSKKNPDQAFLSEDPLLLGIRVERLKTSPQGCALWLNALIKERNGVDRFNSSEPEWETWKPWKDADTKAIESCDDFPCQVKFDSKEVEALQKVSRDKRMDRFYPLVLERVKGYEKTQGRKVYEFPGTLIEPWSWLEKKGFVSSLTRPNEVSLGIRRLELQGNIDHVIRQILDRRSAISAEAKEATVWLRDVYNTHYFDGYAEWGDVRCSPDGKAADVVLAYLIELDTFKVKSVFAKLGIGKVTSGVREAGEKILEHWFQGIRSRAEKSPKK